MRRSLAASCALVALALTSAGAARPNASTAADELRLAGGPLPNVVARTAATWCGTPAAADRAPNVVAGHPVHWVYAIPADGADGLATWGSVMQSDAEAIDAWWRSQDPNRTPRNDLAPFACGQQLDITTLRLPQSGSQLAGGARFNFMANALRAVGLGSSATKYVVYYDGPVFDDEICGQGGSDRSGFGLAVLYARACSGASHAVVVAHEVLHALGAVASGAPNACAGENDSHVCDDVRDLMYPFIDQSPLESRVLDVGRNDYYEHAGSWTDTRDSQWLVRLDAQAPLTVAVTGQGDVSADVPGLQCAATCTTTWNSGTRVTLTATPRAGTKLVRWGGACSGAGQCAVTVGQAGGVSALFAPAAYRVAVRVAGQGSVTSGRVGIACRPRCASPFPSYVPLTLTAKPAAGWRFAGWTGACRGTRPTCRVPMTSAVQARARFARVRR